MASRVVYVVVEGEVFLRWTPEGYAWVEKVSLFNRYPDSVKEWLEEDIECGFFSTTEEYKDMVSTTTRKIEFEVDVEYVAHADGTIKATDATLMTSGAPGEIPGYVKGWLENEAKRIVESEKVSA